MASTQVQISPKEHVHNTPIPQFFPYIISPSSIYIEFHISFSLFYSLSLSLCLLSSFLLFPPSLFSCISSPMTVVQIFLVVVSTV